jgi:hypothetical protein
MAFKKIVGFPSVKDFFSIKSIAAERGFSVGTIISHIETLKGLKKIDNSSISHLKNILSEKDFDTIFSELKKSCPYPDLTL